MHGRQGVDKHQGRQEVDGHQHNGPDPRAVVVAEDHQNRQDQSHPEQRPQVQKGGRQAQLL